MVSISTLARLYEAPRGDNFIPDTGHGPRQSMWHLVSYWAGGGAPSANTQIGVSMHRFNQAELVGMVRDDLCKALHRYEQLRTLECAHVQPCLRGWRLAETWV